MRAGTRRRWRPCTRISRKLRLPSFICYPVPRGRCNLLCLYIRDSLPLRSPGDRYSGNLQNDKIPQNPGKIHTQFSHQFTQNVRDPPAPTPCPCALYPHAPRSRYRFFHSIAVLCSHFAILCGTTYFPLCATLPPLAASRVDMPVAFSVVCDNCDASPATVFCQSDGARLFPRHQEQSKPSAPMWHDWRPIQ